MQRLLEGSAHVESEFERRLLKALIAAGYRVRPQYPVGAYRIDMVVEDGGRRLAVECDGDRFHPPEQIPRDMARQEQLERMGWEFVRIRGSMFFRSPDVALAPLFRWLEEKGIYPQTGTVPDDPVESDLLGRVTRRAEQIRREWEAAAELQPELVNRRTARTRRKKREHGAEARQADEPNTPVQNPLFGEPQMSEP